MKRTCFLMLILLVSFPLIAVPGSSGKLAGTETAFIDDSYANVGVMDTTFNLFEVVSLKSNILFDAIGLYNIGVKAGYRFKELMNLRLAVGYTWFYLNEKQLLLGVIRNLAGNKGIIVNSVNLGIKGQKFYAALMLPLYGFNINANFGVYASADTPPFMKATLGLERAFFNNHLSVFFNGGLYFNTPESIASAAAQAIYYNTLKSNVYADGGLRFYAGDHFNLDLGMIYPGINVPLGTDPGTGAETALILPVLPIFNVAYRF